MNKIQLEIVEEGFTKSVTNVMMTAQFRPPTYLKLTKACIGGAVSVDPSTDIFTLLKTEEIIIYEGGHGTKSTHRITSYDEKHKVLKLEQVNRGMMPMYTMGKQLPKDFHFEDTYMDIPIRYYYSQDEDKINRPIKLVLPDGAYYRFDEETKKINLKVLEEWIGHDIILYKNGFYTGLKKLTKAGLNRRRCSIF